MKFLRSKVNLYYVFSFENVTMSTYAAQTLCDKILREYSENLCSCKLSNKQGIIIYNTSISKETARLQMYDQSIKKAAMSLQSEIMSMMSEQDELPRPINPEAVMLEQGEPPKSLL